MANYPCKPDDGCLLYLKEWPLLSMPSVSRSAAAPSSPPHISTIELSPFQSCSVKSVVNIPGGCRMQIVDNNNRIKLDELSKMAEDMFGDLVKAAVDVARNMMVVDAELHADEEALLIEHGSDQTDLWGINLYPGLEGDDFVEFDSMINLRPSRGNRGRGVEDPTIRERIRRIVNELVIR
jgi:hypothetical protein